MREKTRFVAVLVLAFGLLVQGSATTALAQEPSKTGILILAHGGQTSWNDHVTALAAALGDSQPVEVAFGMASRPSIQAGVDKLAEQGASRIVAVPWKMRCS